MVNSIDCTFRIKTVDLTFNFKAQNLDFDSDFANQDFIEGLLGGHDSILRYQPIEPIDEPEVSVPQPEVLTSYDEIDRQLFGEPISSESSEPEVLMEPEVTDGQPEVAVSRPEVAVSQPEVAVSQLEVTIHQPEVENRQPEVTKTKSVERSDFSRQQRKRKSRKSKSRKALQPLCENRQKKRKHSSSSSDSPSNQKQRHQYQVRKRSRKLSHLYDQLRTLIQVPHDCSQPQTLQFTLHHITNTQREQAHLETLNQTLQSENSLLKQRISYLERKLGKNSS